MDDAEESDDDFQEIEVDNRTEEQIVKVKCKAELQRYKKLPTIPLDVKMNTSDWWRQKRSEFPLMYPLVTRFLCIMATSAPSERLFSVASRMISLKRGRLDPDLCCSMMLLHQNKYLLEKYKNTDSVLCKYKHLPGVYKEFDILDGLCEDMVDNQIDETGNLNEYNYPNLMGPIQVQQRDSV